MSGDESLNDVSDEMSDKIMGTEKTEDSAGRKPRAFTAAPLFIAGLGLACLAGAAGGWAASKYFSPPPADLTPIEARLYEFEQNTTSQSELNQAALKKAEAQRAQIKAEFETFEAGARAAQNGPAGVPENYSQFQRKTNRELSALKARLDKIEAGLSVRDDLSAKADAPQTGSVKTKSSQGEAAVSSTFPKEDIFAQLSQSGGSTEGRAAPQQGWWGKLVKRHVALKRTDKIKVQAVLEQIETAIQAGDWPAAHAFSEDLPEPAKAAAQEWIAKTQP